MDQLCASLIHGTIADPPRRREGLLTFNAYLGIHYFSSFTNQISRSERGQQVICALSTRLGALASRNLIGSSILKPGSPRTTMRMRSTAPCSSGAYGWRARYEHAQELDITSAPSVVQL